MVELYLISSKDLEDPNLFTAALQCLPIEEQKKSASFRNQQRARIHVCSRLLLQKALKKHGCALSECVIGKHGKPYLKKCSQLYFNLSHSGDNILLGLSSHEIGVDIEMIRERIPSNLKRILSEEELSFLSQKTEEEKKQVFFQLWTMKEAFVKKKGARIFDQAPLISMIHNGVYAKELENSSIKCFFDTDYTAAVCAEEDISQVFLKSININKLLNEKI